MKRIDVNRRRLMMSGVCVAGLAATGCVSPQAAEPADFLQQAHELLKTSPAIDIHAHPGRTFGRDATDLSPALKMMSAGGPSEDRAIADMREGQLAGASFAVVADVQVLNVVAGGGLGAAREFKPGEARASYERQVANMHRVLPELGVTFVKEPGDFRRIQAKSGIAGLLTVEGADFLDGDLANVRKAFDDGVRSITLVHYRPNEVGDIQTAPPLWAGLPPFGANVVREMNRLGMVVDLAHASENTAAAALAVSRVPVMCSHTHVNGRGAEHPRFISMDLAKEIGRRGGVIGAWPAGIGMKTLDEYVDRIIDLADVLGPEHVSLGTDMDANFQPVMTSYRQLPELVAGLLRKGYGKKNTAGFVGGNFLRVYEAVWAGRKG
ncbi:MAG TPA: membrane dipeptidase [Hyphomonadaceae bacterium]|nr:membrane dipeptidase [Hyphomonadaceae bacterium]